MQPFEFSLRLGMADPPVDHADIQLHAPDVELGDAARAGRAPGLAIVTEHGPGQAIALKDRRQRVAHRCSPLIGQAGDGEQEAAVIVLDRQRVDPTGAGRMPAFEIHLPEIVRGVGHEAGPGGGRLVRGNQPVAVEDPGDRAGRRRIRHPQREQAMMNLAPAPGGMSLPDLQDLRFQVWPRSAAVRCAVAASGPRDRSDRRPG